MVHLRRGAHLRIGIGGLCLAMSAAGLAVFLRERPSSAATAGVGAVAIREASVGVANPATRPTRTPHKTPDAETTSARPTRAAALTGYGRTVRAHLGPGGRQADDSFVGRPALSADGRRVAFASLAGNLVPRDGNTGADVFVRDRLTRRTVLVSATPEGRPGSAPSNAPALSADGRWVAFESWAPDLVPGALARGRLGVFLRDLRTGSTQLLSTAAAGRADGDSEAPAISADGSRVAFASLATNLVPGDSNHHSDVFVWTRGKGVERVSRDSAGGDLPGGSAAPALSADGSRVAFPAAGTRGGLCEDVQLKNLDTGALDLITVGDGCGRFSDVAISGDGQHVAYSTPWPMTRQDRDWTPDVYVRDVSQGRTTLVSGGMRGIPAASERGASYAPALDHDGRWVAFTSFASDLLSRDVTREQDAYLRDLRTDRLTRIASSARVPNGSTYGAVLSPDAAHLAFGAGAENLVGVDNNHSDDVFVIDRAGDRYPVDGQRRARDRSAPNTDFEHGPARIVPAGLLRFELWTDEAGVRFQCMLDGTGWRPCDKQFWRRVGPGHHVLQARAVDAAGNADRSPAGRVFTVRP